MEVILFNGIKISTNFKDEYQEKQFEKYFKHFPKGYSFSDDVKLKLYTLLTLMKDGTSELQEGLDKLKDEIDHYKDIEDYAFSSVLQNASSEIDKELAYLYEKYYYDIIREKILKQPLDITKITVLIDWISLKKEIKRKYCITILNPFISGRRINIIEGFIILKRAVHEAIRKEQ